MNIEELIEKLVNIKNNYGSDIIVNIQNGDEGGDYYGSREFDLIDANDVVMGLSKTIILG